MRLSAKSESTSGLTNPATRSPSFQIPLLHFRMTPAKSCPGTTPFFMYGKAATKANRRGADVRPDRDSSREVRSCKLDGWMDSLSDDPSETACKDTERPVSESGQLHSQPRITTHPNFDKAFLALQILRHVSLLNSKNVSEVRVVVLIEKGESQGQRQDRMTRRQAKQSSRGCWPGTGAPEPCWGEPASKTASLVGLGLGGWFGCVVR
jgi:hypothetical protein